MSILVGGRQVPVVWSPSDLTGPDSDGHVGRFRFGRSGTAQSIRAIVHHRVVGTLESMTNNTFYPTTDNVLRAGERRVSSHFGIGFWGDELRIAQYIALENTAYCNGQSDSDRNLCRWQLWIDAGRPDANGMTVSIEHEDNAAVDGGDGRYVVRPEIVQASIELGRLLLSGDASKIRAAGIHCNDLAASQLAKIVPSRETLVDHNVVAPVSKPYCWRPIGDDQGFPQARYITALTGAAQEDDVPLIDFTLPKNEVAGAIKVKEGGASVVTIDGGDRPQLTAGMVRPAIGGAPGSDDQLRLGIRGALPHYLVFIGTDEIGFVAGPDVEFEPYTVAGPQKYPVVVGGKPVGEVALP
jgi:hypothetical protein